MLLAPYIDQVISATESQQGTVLAQYISLSRLYVDVDVYAPSMDQIQQICSFKLASLKSFGEILTNTIKARKHIVEKQYLDAHNCEMAAVIKFIEIFREETNWVLPVLRVLVIDARLVATMADENSRGNYNLRNAEQHLKKAFSMAANDRAPAEQNKKIGSLQIVNELFKIYFKLHTYNLCRNLIRAVEGPAFLDFEQFPKGDRVAYNYYVGRLSILDDKLIKAEQDLDYAWITCDKKHVRNKRMILRFLLPVKLSRGFKPSTTLLQSYKLSEYKEFAEAVCSGDLKTFDDDLKANRISYIYQGVILMIEQLRYIVYRNFLKKVYLIGQSHQMRFDDLLAAYKVVAQATSNVFQLECVISNLIFQGFVKGYIHHQKRVLVVSKTLPFPPITSVTSNM